MHLFIKPVCSMLQKKKKGTYGIHVSMLYIGIIIMLTLFDYLALDSDFHPRPRNHNPGMDWYIFDNHTTHNTNISVYAACGFPLLHCHSPPHVEWIWVSIGGSLLLDVDAIGRIRGAGAATLGSSGSSPAVGLDCRLGTR